jgi:colanic acid biosynthesis glycosyl transferase WcaI
LNLSVVEKPKWLICKMKILILSQYCFPETDMKTLPLAKILQSKGHEVEILTGYPNQPTGKLFPGYVMKLFFSEYIEGVKINRVPLYINHSKSKAKRVMNYLSFLISASLIGVWMVKKPQLIYTYHGPGTIAIPAIFLKMIYRSKIFYDINDYWPDTLEATGMVKSKFIIKLVGFFCSISYKFFDNINAVTNGFKQKLLDVGVPESKITVVYNWSLPMDSQHCNDFEKYRNIFKEYFTIIYAGNIGFAQSLGVLIEAAIKLKEAKIDRIKIMMLGDGTQKQRLCQEVEKHDLGDYFCFTGFIPAVNVGEFLQAAEILFLHLKNDPLFEITLPSKLGSYFSIGKPVLCGVTGESSNIVNAINSGLCFASDDSNDLFNKINFAMKLKKCELEKMGGNGKRFYDENISFEIGTKKFEEIFIQMLRK